MLNRDDVELARGLERCETPSGGFPHASHLRVAWVYLHECQSIDQAIDRMAETLRRFAASVGQPEKYSDPTTAFWMLQVAAARAAMPSASFEEVVQRLSASPGQESHSRARGLPCHYVWFRRFIGRRTGSVSSSPICVMIRFRRVRRTSSRSLATSGPATIAELHRGLAHKRSTLTSILDRLSDRGYVTRDVGVADRRTFMITPTAKGLQIAKRVHRHLSDLEDAVARRVTADE